MSVSDPVDSDFPHEHARSRAFRWGEDGIAGVCDTHGFQNIAFSFWNEEECVDLARIWPGNCIDPDYNQATSSRRDFSVSLIPKETMERASRKLTSTLTILL